MATSILDYIFRELAVSYLGRTDLAHVDPSDLMPDAMGDGTDEGTLEGEARPADMVQQVVAQLTSKGFVRSQELKVYEGGLSATGTGGGVAPSASAPEALQAAGGLQEITTEVTETIVAVDAKVMDQTDARLDQIREARMKGYEGDSCGECGNFTLVRNGTCLKCNTCGATSGCS